MRFSDLQPNQDVFFYMPRMGVVLRYTYKHDKTFETAHGNLVELTDEQLGAAFQTEEHAHITVYKESAKQLKKQIDEYEDILRIANRNLNELDKKYGYLINKYPEDFV